MDPVALGSKVALPQPKPPTNKAVKHRACDECRTRKLACSKDPDGCERCKGENIVCHYSEQKPMGRPRKRQFIEREDEDTPNQNDLTNPIILDIPDGCDPILAEPYYTNGQSALGLPAETTHQGRATKTSDGRTIWHFGVSDMMAGPPIDFGDISLPSDGSVPVLEAPTQSSVSDSEHSTPPNLGPCSCLPSMYLSLSSLQNLPTDVIGALKTVREAAATAAECIWCPQCGSVVLDNPNPPIESFQNFMLLGTLLPIIANGYQKLLTLVDYETDEAEILGLTKTFRFQDYGGMCGKQQSIEAAMQCMEKELMFNAVEMPAQQWRTTVRALLRVDIYGHEQAGLKHKGLRDLVSEMETRQRARHTLLDAYIAGGASTMQLGQFGQKLCEPVQSHGCLEILKMSKVAIDSLVIA